MPAPSFAAKIRRLKEESSFLRHYLWKYRRLVGVGLLALLIVDALEILPPILLKEAVDLTVAGATQRELLGVALVYFGVAAAQGICRYSWRMYLVRASMLSGRDLRNRFTRHLFGLSASFFDKRRIGDLMSLANNDADAVRMALGPGLLVLADAVFYLISVPIAMFLLSPKLAVLAFIPLPLIPWLVLRNEREFHARYERVQESFSTLSAMAQETLSGVRVIKAFAREDARQGQFRGAGEEYIHLNMRLAAVQSSFGPMLDFFMSLGMVLLLVVGGKAAIGGTVTLGTFVAFQRFIQKMIWPMTALGIAVNHYQRAVASGGRIQEVLSQRTDVPEAERPVLPPRALESGRVECRKLRFRYPGTDRLVLSDISLVVEPGQRVAFVGPVGAGKSSLLSLLPRLYPVEPGMLLVDGIDVNEWPMAELRARIGYVGQEVFLFSEDVVENIAFGLGEAPPTDRIERAALMAAVHEEILGFPQGYGTRLGERGVNLSGGQKQRLTIARALIKRPPILVLDDALAAVDVQTEERILRGLRGREGRNTELISAHRISTIQDSDLIVVMDHGGIVERGRHGALIARRGGLYRRFYDQQRLKEDLERYVEEVESRA